MELACTISADVCSADLHCCELLLSAVCALARHRRFAEFTYNSKHLQTHSGPYVPWHLLGFDARWT